MERYNIYYNYCDDDNFELYEKGFETNDIELAMNDWAEEQGEDYIYNLTTLEVYDHYGNVFKFVKETEDDNK